jgi:hypothetical protein
VKEEEKKEEGEVVERKSEERYTGGGRGRGTKAYGRG